MGLFLIGVFSLLTVVAIFFYYAIGSTETKEFDEAIASLIAFLSLVVPTTALGVWSQRKAALRQGITADFLGSLSWSERREFLKKHKLLDE